MSDGDFTNDKCDGLDLLHRSGFYRVGLGVSPEGSTLMEEVCGSCGQPAPIHLNSCPQGYLHQDAIFKERPAAPHYQKGGIEPIDFIASQGMSFNQGNVVKYVTRYKYKGKPLDDLLKARVYLNWLIEEEEHRGK